MHCDITSSSVCCGEQTHTGNGLNQNYNEFNVLLNTATKIILQQYIAAPKPNSTFIATRQCAWKSSDE